MQETKERRKQKKTKTPSETRKHAIVCTFMCSCCVCTSASNCWLLRSANAMRAACQISDSTSDTTHGPELGTTTTGRNTTSQAKPSPTFANNTTNRAHWTHTWSIDTAKCGGGTALPLPLPRPTTPATTPSPSPSPPPPPPPSIPPPAPCGGWGEEGVGLKPPEDRDVGDVVEVNRALAGGAGALSG